MNTERAPLASLILAAGIALAGFLTGIGIARVRSAERYVTVKGISEREARADLAIWPLRVSAASNDLAVAHGQLENSVTRIKQFLGRYKIDTTEIALQEFRVTDAFTNQYGGAERITSRYVIHETVLVRSSQPDLILAASQKLAELVSAGVVLSSGEEFGGGGPTFVFTGLNKLKPEMIAEATARAREAAEQFARDSRTTLGGIKRASQGVFEILPRDQAQGITEASQIVKTVRVVSTVDYLLR